MLHALQRTTFQHGVAASWQRLRSVVASHSAALGRFVMNLGLGLGSVARLGDLAERPPARLTHSIRGLFARSAPRRDWCAHRRGNNASPADLRRGGACAPSPAGICLRASARPVARICAGTRPKLGAGPGGLEQTGVRRARVLGQAGNVGAGAAQRRSWFVHVARPVVVVNQLTTKIEKARSWFIPE